MSTRPLYLVDASLYIFRAFFSLPDTFTDAEGRPANAVYGFARFLCALLQETRPTHMAVAFDESLTTSYRNEIYPQYKANREKPPIELKQQFSRCRQVAEALGLPCFSHNSYEADDLIGTLGTQFRAHGFDLVIISADKDLTQLLRGSDIIWDYARGQMDIQGVTKKFGVTPAQMIDYLSLTGDAVDNIPGVPGIGPKTAASLLQHFDTLDEIYERLDEIPYLRIRGAKSLRDKLKRHRDDALLARELVTIACDIPLDVNTEDLLWQGPNMPVLEPMFDELRFGPILRRQCRELASGV